MKRIFTNILAGIVLTACLFGFSACKSSCKDKETEQTEAERNSSLMLYDDGVHEFSITETSTPLVENGRTEYVVVVPKSDAQNSYEKKVFTAIKEEFSYLFKEATNISVRIISDDTLSHSKDNRYISIGETSLFKSSGLSYDKAALGNDGVRIMTKDDTLFLLGGAGYGPLYAVYDFMEIMFHFDVFDIDSIMIDRNVTDINLKNMDITDIPDMAQRIRNLGTMVKAVDESNIDNKYYGTRMRLQDDGLQTVLPFYHEYNPSSAWAHGHNSTTALSRKTYEAEHPKWYSDNGDQLCYTAHGDANELRAMAEEVVKKTIYSLYLNPISKMPLANSVTFCMADNYEFCTCSTCMQERTDYSTSGSIVRFTNTYAKIFEEWNNGKPASELFQYASADEEWLNINIDERRSQYIREDFFFYLMVYNNQILAPAKYDGEKKEYVALDESCVFNENVMVYFCDIEMDWSQSYFAEDNKESYDNILAWSTLSKRGMRFYNYIWYPDRPLWFYDSFSAVSPEQIAFMLNAGAKTSYFCGESGNGSVRSSGFKAYWSYLQSKLLWNVNQNVEELTARYFDNVFGDASDIMKNLFEEERNYFQYQYAKNELHVKNSIYNKLYNPTYWDQNVMKKWINDCYAAFSAIEKTKTVDSEEYEAQYSHIAAEMIYPASIYLEYFRDKISTDEKTALADRLWADYQQMGLTDAKMWFPYGGVTYKSKIESWRN